MESRFIDAAQIAAFRRYLFEEEREPGTVEKYCRDVRNLTVWLDGREAAKETCVGWKEHLQKSGYAPATVNSMIAAANRFFAFRGWNDIHIKALRLQRRLFRDADRELSREEYRRLVAAARERNEEHLALLMETICATGIRVSEVRYITVEAARRGQTEISLKGKIRTILLPASLRRKLLRYAKSQKRISGEIFLSRNGNPLDRRQIWAEMKRLCRKAGVEPSKVFPHNLRHLFATVFYKVCRDIVKLADVLGHSSIETTRIYLLTSGAEHSRQLERLGLVS